MKEAQLKRCQVETPHDVVRLVWSLVAKFRPKHTFESVLDLGAGDGRFSHASEMYKKYTGIEYDAKKAGAAELRNGAELIVADALKWKQSDYDICIGNPPYIRHHGLDPAWKDAVLKNIYADGGPALKKTANAFIIFLTQALMRTRADGIVAQVVPYEWVSRPSARELRDYIESKGWDVHVYRFDSNIFPSVLTTASISIIDKKNSSGEWRFGSVSRSGEIKLSSNASGTRSKVISYANGIKECKAIRGLSPGGQKIFVLTEEERLFHSLKRNVDVRPCVTSLRSVDLSTEILDRKNFEDLFVQTGARCWLIRSDRDKLSPELMRYLDGVHDAVWKMYSTCTARSVWWKYKAHPVPSLLLASGFTKKRPKVLRNELGAIAAGSVYGVLIDQDRASTKIIFEKLLGYDFQRRLVHHSNGLKKIEVRQLNAVLADLLPD